MKIRTLLYLGRSFFACRFLGRRYPLALAFELTHECNLSCPHCYTQEPLPTLEEKDHLRILDEAARAGCRVVSFTGGEPLLVDHLPELISRAKALGMWVQFTTNGHQIPAVARELDRSRFDLIQISLDGDRPSHEAIRGAGSFEPVMAALELIQRYGWSTLILSVITRHSTFSSLTFAIAQALRVGGFVSFQPICDVPDLAPGRSEFEELLDFLEAVKKSRSFRRLHQVLSHYGTKEILDLHVPDGGSFYNPMDQSITLLRYLRRFPNQGSIPCAAGKLFVRIRPDGQLVPCYYAIERENPVNVAGDGFDRAWENLNEPDCTDCWHHHRLELNLIYNLSLSTLKDVLLYHLPRKYAG